MIEPTQELENPYTLIPKSFVIEVDGKKLWVCPNGAKHLIEETSPGKKQRKQIGGLRAPWDIEAKEYKLSHELLLEDFQGALREATKKGIEYNEIKTVKNWQLIIGPARVDNGYPTVFHARRIKQNLGNKR